MMTAELEKCFLEINIYFFNHSISDSDYLCLWVLRAHTGCSQFDHFCELSDGLC